MGNEIDSLCFVLLFLSLDLFFCGNEVVFDIAINLLGLIVCNIVIDKHKYCVYMKLITRHLICRQFLSYFMTV